MKFLINKIDRKNYFSYPRKTAVLMNNYFPTNNRKRNLNQNGKSMKNAVNTHGLCNYYSIAKTFKSQNTFK